MAIILDRPGFGAQLGTSLGSGLGRAFESLANQKIQDMQQRQSLSNLIRSGVSPEDAQLISLFASKPELQQKLLSGLWERSTPQMPGTQAPVQSQEGMPSSQDQLQPQEAIQAGEQQRSSFYNVPPREQREREKLKLKERQVVSQEQKAIRPKIEKAAELARVANQELSALDSLEKALQSPDIRTPFAQAALQKLGITNFAPDTKVGLVNKIVNQFALRNLQNIPGGSKSAVIFNKLEQGLPSLLQTPQGNELIIDSLRLAAEEQKAYFEELEKQAINGEYPKNAVEIATKKTEERMAERYVEKNKRIDKILGIKNEGNLSAGAILDTLPKVEDIPVDKRNTIQLVDDKGNKFVIRNGRWTKG